MRSRLAKPLRPLWAIMFSAVLTERRIGALQVDCVANAKPNAIFL